MRNPKTKNEKFEKYENMKRSIPFMGYSLLNPWVTRDLINLYYREDENVNVNVKVKVNLKGKARA